VQIREQSKNLLRDLINEALLVQKAKDEDIDVETEIVKRLDEIRKEYKLGTLEDLEKEAEKEGRDWEDFKDQIRRQLLMQDVIRREVGSRLMLSREDERKYYEEHKKEFESPGLVHLDQILISNEKRTPAETEKRAKDAIAEIKAGERFSDVAKKYSDDPNAEGGGDIGYVKEGTMKPAIAEVVNKLDVNETSDLIPISSGYLILKVVERFSPGIPKFEEVEERVGDALYREKMEPKLREFLVQLRKESFIFLAPGYVDTGAQLPSETQLAKKEQ
jgi:peptidyl-prolyl cis-trans isomerase SurA